jgi:hypothetical protein
MKSKLVILILGVFIFSSCIVKSLHPFYTKDKISFNKNLIGTWIDKKGNEWEIESVKEQMLKDQKEGLELSKEDKQEYENYKDAYLIGYTKKEKEAGFIAMPFIVDGQYFMDFIPFDIDDIQKINDLASEHLLKTHSVVKLDIDTNHKISFSWLSEETIGDLIDNQKIRLKHEVLGLEEDLLLTASSEELSSFLQKLLKADIEDKWKESDTYSLTRTYAKS